MKSEPRATEVWRQELRRASASSYSSADLSDLQETLRWNWLVAIAAKLELARRLKIDQNRLSYFWVELQTRDYDVAQADRAETWLLFGDWTFRGTDPTLELADFYPSDEQHGKAAEKIRPRSHPVTEPKPQERPLQTLMTDAERRWWALEIIGYYEPRWQKNHPGFALSVPWINDHRGDAEALKIHMQTRDGGYRANY